MEYSAIHKRFIITQNELDLAVNNLKYAMKKARQIAKVGLGKRKGVELKEIDHLERAILEAGKNFGINFGTEWGGDIDLTDFD